MKRDTLALIAVTSLLTGCSDTLSPSRFVGTYQLSAVNGAGLPVTVAALPSTCTTRFSFGRLTLADGAFTFAYSYANACPGSQFGTSGLNSVGGGLTVQGQTVVLRAIDPTSPTQSVIEARFIISGSEGALVVPAGALQLASATTFNFGPTLQAAPLPPASDSRSN